MAFSLCFRSIIFLQLWCIPFCCGKANFQRLPTSVKPTLYELYFKPDLKTFKFDGNETVHLQILQSTNEIHINCLDIRINHVRLRLLPSGEVYAPDLFLDAKEETLKMTFKKELPPGEAKLSVEFTGELNTLMKGFYRSKYTSASGGEEKYCAVTQFEATDARRCFPCWDEPAIKARFDITLSIDKEMIALSNMPVEKEYIEGELKMVKFQRTPIMSTYLLAMVVGNFDYVEDKTPDGVVVRVYTPPGKKEQGRWALNVATKTLPYYKDYFNVAYPLPKMDLIGISDIAVGAMENWGLITYAETCLLVDQLQTSAGTKQNVALVVAHELAHQWFGNLVTMEWWSDLWLNEGYATFIEYLCVDFLFPEYDIWSQFVTDTYCDALESDALKNSHPIEAPVQHPAEINENFDRISYDKSGSVIRMLHRYIGDDDFRKGMNLYLTRYQYNNTVTEDLWSALEEACGKPVTSMMRTWTRQKGFPMITVEIADQDNNARTLVVSQTKFSADGSEKDDPTQWLVPLSFSKQSNPKEECSSAVLEGLQSKITISNISADDWIKVNPGAVGFYRTRYSDDMLNRLIPSISNKILPPVDRMNILDDLFALVMAGEADSVKLLDLMLAMIDEDDYNVWANIATYLDKFDNLLNNFPFHQQFKVYGLKLIKPISKKLGFEPKPEETHLVKLLRSLVLHCLVIFDDQEFLSVASDQFSHHISGKKAISPDLRLVVYRAVIAAQGKAAFLSLVKLFKKTDLLEEKGRILKSFFAIRSADLIDEALKFAESSDVSLANFVLALSSLSFSKAGREKTWQYVKDNWQSLYSKYPAGFLLSAIVRCTTENFVSDEKADEIEQFFKPKKIEGIERTLLQSLESIRINARWLRKEKDAVESYFEKFKS